jgi:hypothetical protein
MVDLAEWGRNGKNWAQWDKARDMVVPLAERWGSKAPPLES